MPKRKTPKNVLGRGLNALLSSDTALDKNETAVYGNQLKLIAINRIEINPFQPRKDFDETALQELSDSIKVHGIIQPLTVKQLERNQFQLIAGERRMRAALLANMEHVPAYIRKADDQQMLELALIENIQREALNPIEIALSYERLITECTIKQETLGLRVGKNRTTVSNYLRLLKLPPAIQIALRDQKISMGHARALINITATATQLTLLKKIITEDLSVRNVEELVKGIKDMEQKLDSEKEKKRIRDPGFRQHTHLVSKQLATKLAATVAIQTNKDQQGAIKISFKSRADLDRIWTIMNNEIT